MKGATPLMRNVAARVIAYEAKQVQSSGGKPPAVFHVCERLRPHLSMLMGKAGFRALLSRALSVTQAEVPWLAVMVVDADGALAGWEQVGAEVAAEELTESSVLLVAQLLGLLVAFIGDNLTLRLVRDVWPALSLEELNFTQGESV